MVPCTRRLWLTWATPCSILSQREPVLHQGRVGPLPRSRLCAGGEVVAIARASRVGFAPRTSVSPPDLQGVPRFLPSSGTIK